MPRLASAVALLFASFAASGAFAQQAVTNEWVNLRAGPDRDYPLVARLAPNTPVQVEGCVAGYSWCDVSFGPDHGWVYARYLSYPYRQRPVPILGYGAAIGLPIVIFSIGSYWDLHYRYRPWYGQRPRWEHRPPPRPIVVRPAPRPPVHPPVVRPPVRPPVVRPPAPAPRPPHVRPPSPPPHGSRPPAPPPRPVPQPRPVPRPAPPADGVPPPGQRG